MNGHYPSLQRRRSGLINERVDEARRELWRAYQHGSLTAEELASTLERLGYFGVVPEPEIDQSAETSASSTLTSARHRSAPAV
jgi:hypothetical protein